MKDVLYFVVLIIMVVASRYVVRPFCEDNNIMWLWWVYYGWCMVMIAYILWGKNDTK